MSCLDVSHFTAQYHEFLIGSISLKWLELQIKYGLHRTLKLYHAKKVHSDNSDKCTQIVFKVKCQIPVFIATLL